MHRNIHISNKNILKNDEIIKTIRRKWFFMYCKDERLTFDQVQALQERDTLIYCLCRYLNEFLHDGTITRFSTSPVVGWFHWPVGLGSTHRSSLNIFCFILLRSGEWPTLSSTCTCSCTWPLSGLWSSTSPCQRTHWSTTSLSSILSSFISTYAMI